MKQAILFAVAAFLISTGATSFVLVRRHHSAVVAPPDSAIHPSDSTAGATKSAPADSTPAVAVAPRPDSSSAHDSSAFKAKPDSAPKTRPVDSTRAKAAPDSVARAPALPKPPAPIPHPTAPVIPEDPAAKAAAYKQVARVLSAMKPPEAVKVMAYLSDDEVEGLLRSVGPRQAADFLTNMPKERAAKLSQRLLVPEPSR